MAFRPRTLGWYRLVERVRVTELTETFLAEGERGSEAPEQAFVTQLLPTLRADPELDAVLLAQVKAAGLIQHPNLEAILDAGRSKDPNDPGSFVAHEYAEAWTLREVLQRAKAVGRALPPWLACTLAFDVLNGLHALHANASGALMPAHLHLSPDQITIGLDGSVRVRGVGLTLAARLAASTSSRSLAKELAWRAPPQLTGDGPEPSSDLFTVGLLLWEMLLGSPLLPRHNNLLKLGDLRDHDPVIGRLDFPHLRCPGCRWRPEPASRWTCAAGCGASVTPLYTRGNCPLCGLLFGELSCPECKSAASFSEWETVSAERLVAANLEAGDARVNSVGYALGSIEVPGTPIPGLDQAASLQLSDVLREAFAAQPLGFRAAQPFQLALDEALTAHGMRRSNSQLSEWMENLFLPEKAGPVPQPLSQAPTLGEEEATTPGGRVHHLPPRALMPTLKGTEPRLSRPPGNPTLPPNQATSPPGHGALTPGHGTLPPGHTTLPPGYGALTPGHGTLPPGHTTLPPGTPAEPQSMPTLVPVSMRSGGPTLREGEYRAVSLPLPKLPETTSPDFKLSPLSGTVFSKQPSREEFEQRLHEGSDPERTAVSAPERPAVSPPSRPSAPKPISEPEKTAIEPSMRLASPGPARAPTAEEHPIEPSTDPSGARVESGGRTVVHREPRAEGGLFGSYRLVSRLGRGGMAETWRAQLVGAAGVTRPAVIKRILPHLAQDPSFVSAFINEARVTATLSHGNIAQVYDFGQTSGEYFIALEYVQGRTLEAVIERAGEKGFHHLAPAVACFVVCEMLEGLHYAHTRTADDGHPLNLVHRDISADNVIIGFDGQTKLVDFGVAKARIKGRTETQPGLVKGKWSHFSPEQAAGEEVDHRSDIFTTGVVLYRMLCGQHPFPGTIERAMRAIVDGQYPPPATVNPTLPDELSAIVTRAMENNPARRFQTALEMETALRQHLMKIAPDFNTETLKGFVLWLFEDELSSEGVLARARKTEVERFTRWASENKVALKSAAERAETRSALERVVPRPAAPQLFGLPRAAAVGLLVLAAVGAALVTWLAFGGAARTAEKAPAPPEVQPMDDATLVKPSEDPAPPPRRTLIGRIQDTGSSLRITNGEDLGWHDCKLWVPPDQFYAWSAGYQLKPGAPATVPKGALTRAEQPRPSQTEVTLECREGELRERL